MKLNKKGYSMIELLISLVILSIAMGSIVNLYTNYVDAYKIEGARSRAQETLRSSLNMVTRDIRMSGLDPKDTDNFGIVQASAQSLRFSADRDMDGELDQPNVNDGSNESDMEHMAYVYNGSDRLEQVLYNLDGTEHDRSTLVKYVSDFQLTYFDASGTETSDLSEIRTVGIQMTIRKPAGDDEIVSRTLIKRVKCRNLGI
jgi:prepilin-type N-terminal cleavage/methylation domain-containing protein